MPNQKECRLLSTSIILFQEQISVHDPPYDFETHDCKTKKIPFFLPTICNDIVDLNFLHNFPSRNFVAYILLPKNPTKPTKKRKKKTPKKLPPKNST